MTQEEHEWLEAEVATLRADLAAARAAVGEAGAIGVRFACEYVNTRLEDTGFSVAVEPAIELWLAERKKQA